MPASTELTGLSAAGAGLGTDDGSALMTLLGSSTFSTLGMVGAVFRSRATNMPMPPAILARVSSSVINTTFFLSMTAARFNNFRLTTLDSMLARFGGSIATIPASLALTLLIAAVISSSVSR